VQYRAEGFFRNARQHGMASLAMTEVAQAVAASWRRAMGPHEAGAGAGAEEGAVAGDIRSPLGWQDVFDVVVRWRQISEPAAGLYRLNPVVTRRLETAWFQPLNPIKGVLVSNVESAWFQPLNL
jgi:hypothetical protein